MTFAGWLRGWTVEPLQIRISTEEVVANLLGSAVAESPKPEPAAR